MHELSSARDAGDRNHLYAIPSKLTCYAAKKVCLMEFIKICGKKQLRVESSVDVAFNINLTDTRSWRKHGNSVQRWLCGG